MPVGAHRRAQTSNCEHAAVSQGGGFQLNHLYGKGGAKSKLARSRRAKAPAGDGSQTWFLRRRRGNFGILDGLKGNFDDFGNPILVIYQPNLGHFVTCRLKPEIWLHLCYMVM